MVEMVETANILHHATERSLVVLDEIGRGTSTLDGLSLAWAIAEHLAGDASSRGPRTLFATHYHELTDLAERLPDRVRNLQVAVREWNEEVVFLHRIAPGAASQSYGLHVARLAGVPEAVTRRAAELLDSLSVAHRHPEPPAARGRASDQPSLFQPDGADHPALDALREVKLETMSPLDAFDALRRIRSLADDGPQEEDPP
jgi:DNA mismatch repair protein MutS